MTVVEAVFNKTVIARSDHTIYLEGNHYFPLEDVNPDYLRSSRAKSLCPWKGIASYYSVEVEDATGRNAAWTYRHPSPPSPPASAPKPLTTSSTSPSTPSAGPSNSTRLHRPLHTRRILLVDQYRRCAHRRPRTAGPSPRRRWGPFGDHTSCTEVNNAHVDCSHRRRHRPR